MSVKIRNHALSLWIIVTMIGVLSATVLAAYLTLTISFTVAEPLEVLDYPSTLNLYPGEATNFSVTIKNHAQVTYAVLLDFTLGNMTYMDKYVKVSNETYFVHPGTQSLAAWLSVSPNATVLNSPLNLSFRREAVETMTQKADEELAAELVTFNQGDKITVVLRSTGTSDSKIVAIYIGTSQTNLTAATVSPQLPQLVASHSSNTFTITQPWISGTRYYFKAVAESGYAMLFNEQP